MKKLLVSAAIAGACLVGVTGQASADGHCGSLTMAEWNWASGELMANVDKIILEEGYGCEVELVAGATMPTFTSMNEKGCLLYTSPSPRDPNRSRMPSSA